MLTIYAMTIPQLEDNILAIPSPANFFDSHTDSPEDADTWLDNIFARKVITDIQHVDVMDTTQHTRTLLASNCIAVSELATGIKNLINCYHCPDDLHRLSRMGPNCFKWLMDVADMHDVKMAATLYVKFTDSDIRGRAIKFEDTGAIVNDEQGFFEEMLKIYSLIYPEEEQ